MKTNKTVFWPALVTAVLASNAALASVTGPLGQQWNVSESGYTSAYVAQNNVTIDANSLSYAYWDKNLDYIAGTVLESPMTYVFTTVATSSGPLTMNLTWSDSVSANFGRPFPTTYLSVFDKNSNSSAPLFEGMTTNQPITTTLNLTAGDVWGFEISVTPTAIRASGTLTFNSVSTVPEPSAVWLLGSGLAVVVGVARRRKAA